VASSGDSATLSDDGTAAEASTRREVADRCSSVAAALSAACAEWLRDPDARTLRLRLLEILRRLDG